jgi:hypothetical protein
MPIAESLGHIDVRSLADSLQRTGFGMVPDVVRPDEMLALRTFARDAVASNRDEYAYLTQDALAGTPIGDLARSRELTDLLSSLYEEAVGNPPSPQEVVHPALRCLIGRTGIGQSLRFHFDSYAITALLPIAIPATGDRGDFLYYPNRRPVRRRALVNLTDKAIYQNPATLRLIASQRFRTARPPRRLQLTPGNLYVFCGYRTLHGNDRCDPDQLRATALFHFGDPHLRNPLVRLMHRRVQRRAAIESAST